MANRAQVHIFGRGRATLQTSDGEVVTSCAPRATLDGVAVRRCPGGGQDYAVWIRGGGLRLHGCDITSASWACLAITDGSNPVVSNCRIHDAQAGVGVGVGGDVADELAAGGAVGGEGEDGFHFGVFREGLGGVEHMVAERSG